MEDGMGGGESNEYKEMYEMGKKLMEMAKAGGYSEDSGEDMEADSYSGEAAPEAGGGDKVSTALSYM